MARNRKSKYRPRRVDFYQDSPFLDLPGEIRTLIYRAALVRDKPIDLWPAKYIEFPAEDPSLGKRIDKARENGGSTPVFRKQEDLQHVRKEMAIGLVATCQQVQREAGHLFWRENTFRFSSDIEWYGIRRFLSAIGPRPISLLQNLEIFAPLFETDGLESAPGSNIHFSDIYEAKNEPKMHMPKARRQACNDSALARNVDFVCQLLDDAQVCLDMHLILPHGFAAIQTDYPDIPENICIGPNFSNLTLFVEAGAFLNGSGYPSELVQREINVVCQTGSFWKRTRDASEEASKITEEKRWSNPTADLDYLNGVATLLSPKEAVIAPGLGGRATKTPGLRKTSRALKGFGGCRFVQRDAFDCGTCGRTTVRIGSHPKEQDSIRTNCPTCGQVTWHDRRDAVEVKMVGRALRQGFTAENSIYVHQRAGSS
jgi:hypothetical protein